MKNKSRGQISGILIILAIVVLVVIVVVFLALKLSAKPQPDNSTPQESIIPEKVYDTTVGNIRFLFELAVDLGDTLYGSTSGVSYQKNVYTTEKFIKLTVGAQNKGKKNISQYSWDMGNIVDSNGRNFVSSNNLYYFLPNPDLCGAMLKPEFEPTPCIKIYEVSKASTDLKVEIIVTDESGKKQSGFLDLDVTQ